MPALFTFIATTVAEALGTAGVFYTTAILVGTITASIIVGGLVIGAVLLTQPRRPGQPAFADAAQRRTQMVRQAITSRKLIFGEIKVSGPIILWETTSNNRFHHIVVPVCDQESNWLGTVFANDTPIYDDQLDAGGNVISGRYNGFMRIKKHLGTPGEVADPDLAAEVDKWTAEHRGREVTYIYIRVDLDREVYPTGMPNFSVIAQGQKIFDPRTSLTRWSPNAAHCIRSYLLNPRYGWKGLTAAGIDDTFFNADANTCEEFVAAPKITHDISSINTTNDELTLDGTSLKFRFKNKIRLTTAIPGTLINEPFDSDPSWTEVGTGTITFSNGQVNVAFIPADASAYIYQTVASQTEAWYETKVTLGSLNIPNNGNAVWGSGFSDSSGVGQGFWSISNVGGTLEWRVIYRSDTPAFVQLTGTSLPPPIADRTYKIKIHWKAATAPAANNGILEMWIDDALAYSQTNLDNDTHTIGRVTAGMVAQPGAASSGTFSFDYVLAGNADSVLPTGLAVDTDYYVIVTSVAGRVIRLATTRQNANDNIFIDLTDSGTGTHTLRLEVLHVVQTVITATDVLELDGEKLAFQTGDKIQMTTTGTLPAGLALATDYYAIVHHEQEVLDDADVILERCALQLASSYFNALDRVAIDITGTGSGTHTVVKKGEPRYTCNGMVDSADDPHKILGELLTSMSGTLTRIGSTWKSLAGVYRAPGISLDEGDLAGPISTPTRVSAKSRFNRIRGTYVNPQNDWQPSDYPAVTKIAYQTADNGLVIDKDDFDLPYTSRSQTAQRLASIILNRMRQEITIESPWNTKAYQAQPGDTENISNTVRGWTNKIFEVVESTPGFVPDAQDVPIWVVKQVLRETAASVFDFNPDVDEVVIDDAPNTNLPNAFGADPPTNLIITEEVYVTRDGTGVKARAILAWSASLDILVREYQVEHKLPADPTWIVQPTTQGLILHLDDIAPDTWQFRVKGINSLGVSTAYATKTQQILGLLVAPTEPQNLTLSIVGGTAYLRWDKSPDVDVRMGGRFIVRHSKKLTGTTWTESVTIGPAIGGQEVLALLPLKAGTYMMKAVDSSNVFSTANASASTKQASVSSFTTTDTLIESPNFTGTKVNVEVVSNILKLTSTGGGVDPSGTYTFSGAFDFGAVVSRRITTLIDAMVVNIDDLIDDRLDLIDDWLDFDGTLQANADAVIEMRQTDDDPIGIPTWGPWERVESGEVEAWGVQLRIQLNSDNTGFNIDISELTVKAESIN